MSDRRVPPGGGFVIGLAITLLFWIALFLFVPKAHAQGILPASTGCIGDSIVTLFREDIQNDSLAKQELDAHEAVHRVQIQEAIDSLHVGCAEALWTLTSSPLINLATEVPAYRAQGEWLRTHRSDVYDQERFYDFVAQALYASYLPPACTVVAGETQCAKNKRPAFPYSFIRAWLALGHRPAWPANPDYPVPSLSLADSLLNSGGLQ